ncbi:hypothetical protein SUGI_0446270 [Cryptomeria japonica]|nr:hypothetical protein SUGI_0446270 [Cryptomeria japonica]
MFSFRLEPFHRLRKIPVNRVCKSVVDAHEEDEKRKLNDCMAFYLQICSQAKVKAKASIVMRADVRRGIVEMVQSRVSGSLSWAHHQQAVIKMKGPGQAGYVLRHAMNSCDVSIASKGKLLALRERSVVDNGHQTCNQIWPQQLKLRGIQPCFDASFDITPAISEASSDIKVPESQQMDGDESQESTEERTATKTHEIASREMQRETAGRENAKAAAPSPDKFRAIEAALEDAILGSRVKDGHCQKLSRRLKEVEEELQAMVDNGRTLATQFTKFSNERHQAVQELHTAEEKLTEMEMQNCHILKEKEVEIKQLQELLHSTSRLETPSSPSTNVEFSEDSMEDIVKGFWCIIFILVFCVIYYCILQ